MEALCILLSEKHPAAKRRTVPGQRREFTSRWKLILSEYNSIRNRLFNSQALLEGTNLVLYAINETTLVGNEFIRCHNYYYYCLSHR